MAPRPAGADIVDEVVHDGLDIPLLADDGAVERIALVERRERTFAAADQGISTKSPPLSLLLEIVVRAYDLSLWKSKPCSGLLSGSQLFPTGYPKQEAIPWRLERAPQIVCDGHGGLRLERGGVDIIIEGTAHHAAIELMIRSGQDFRFDFEAKFGSTWKCPPGTGETTLTCCTGSRVVIGRVLVRVRFDDLSLM